MQERRELVRRFPGAKIYEDVRGRVALMKRGKVALVKKVLHAQDAGALGVIIINKNCSRSSEGLRCEIEAKDKANAAAGKAVGGWRPGAGSS